jgi:ATP-dependent helicase Lhr and Lhr-like helicase
MEEAGQCRRGYFVEGLGAAQFALPGAVDRMRAIAAAQEAVAESLPGGSGYSGGAGSWGAHGGGADSETGYGTGADSRSVLGGIGPGEPEPGADGPEPGPGGPEPGVGVSAAGGHRPLWPGEPPPPTSTPRASGNAWSGGGRGSDGAAGEAGNAGPPITVLAAADPANAFGSALPWPARPGEVPGAHRPGRKAGALVVLSGGNLVLYVERGGKTLLSWTSDPEILVPAAAGLAEAVRGGALGRLTVERADGTGVYDTPLAQALADAGFRPTPRGLRLRR